MTKPTERLLAELPRRKLGRSADWRIRYRLHRTLRQERQSALRPGWLPAWQQGVAVLATLLATGFAGAGAYAYQSDNVTRQHPLYPLKRGLEKTESVLWQTPASQAQGHLKLSERRLAEARELISKGSSQGLDDTLAEAEQELEAAGEDAEKITEPEQKERSLGSVKQAGHDKLDKLESVAAEASLEDDELTDSLARGLYNLRLRVKKTAATSTKRQPEASPDQIKPSDPKKTEEGALKQAKQKIEILKETSEASNKHKKDRLIKNLEGKLERAEQAKRNGDRQQLEQLIKDAEILTATSESFLRQPKNDDTDEPEEKDSKDEERQKNDRLDRQDEKKETEERTEER